MCLSAFSTDAASLAHFYPQLIHEHTTIVPILANNGGGAGNSIRCSASR